jgi:serine/threonine protein kinase
MERLARFEREARLLASLNHPNIAAIHGLEEADGKSFLAGRRRGRPPPSRKQRHEQRARREASAGRIARRRGR